MREKMKKRKCVLAVAGVIVAGLLIGNFFFKEESRNFVNDFVPPPSFLGTVQQINIKNSQMVVTIEKNVITQENMEQKNMVLDCEKVDYKLYNTKPGDQVKFSCKEEALDDRVVKIDNFTREEHTDD